MYLNPQNSLSLNCSFASTVKSSLPHWLPYLWCLVLICFLEENQQLDLQGAEIKVFFPVHEITCIFQYKSNQSKTVQADL